MLTLTKILVLACCVQQTTSHQVLAETHEFQGHLRAGAEEQHDGHNRSNGVIGGVMFGILMWCMVPCCLWNNERIAIKQYKMQLKAERWCVHIDDPSKEPIEELDGRIVYVKGDSTCTENLSDKEFKDVKSEGKIKLRRVVEMFQNIETSEEEDGNTRYKYSTGWCDTPQEVSHDKDKQNDPFPFSSTRRQDGYSMLTAIGAGGGEDCVQAQHENVKVGAYYLSNYVIRELTNWKAKSDVDAAALTHPKLTHHKECIKPDLQSDGYHYYGDQGKIGTIRVKFEELHPGPITIVGVLVKDKKGWSFVPIMRPDSAGAGDSFCAELGGSCCVSVKELHYTGEEDDNEEFKEDVEERPKELTKTEMGGFHRCQTTLEMKDDYKEEDASDLCCGAVVVPLMRMMGLEEQFLGVAEKKQSVGQIMADEGSAAANRHMAMRFLGWFLLTFGAWCIISPVVKLLTMNWLTTLMGGGLIAAFLCCMACLCSCATCISIMSVSWIAHRPWLASVGIATAIIIVLGVNMFIHDEERKHREGQGAGNSQQLLELHHYSSAFLALTQSLATAGSH